MAALLRDPLVLQYDIIAIQEPWLNQRNHRQTHNPTQGHFSVFMTEKVDRPLVCFFVSYRLDKSTIRVKSYGANVATLQWKTEDQGNTVVTSVHNIYNPHCKKTIDVFPTGPFEGISTESILPPLDIALQNDLTRHIVVGDFNLHHPTWSGIDEPPTNHGKRLEPAKLIEMMDRHGLDLCICPGTITRRASSGRQRDTTLDLVWMSSDLAAQLISCKIDNRLDYQSDHLPIATILPGRPQEAPERRRRLFQQTDVRQFTNALTSHLPCITSITTEGQLDETVYRVSTALQNAIEESTPEARICPRSIPGFNDDCRNAIQEVKRAQRRWKNWGGDEYWEELLQAKRHRKKCISKANTEQHRLRVSQVKDEKGLWSLVRWARNRGALQAAFTPDITKSDGTLAQDVESKAAALQESFFPTPPPADLSDIPGYQYSDVGTWKQITQHEIREAIHMVPPDKAPGPDEIPNRILKMACQHMVPLLALIFNSSLRLQYCPQAFKCSVSIALRKPGKEDYSAPKSYRPIALMNTLGKVLDTVLARRIQYAAEVQHLLPATHVGGRKAASCEHGIHLLFEKVFAAWRQRKVASLLLLDVSGAFDNVSHERLLHNLRKRGIHPQLVGWMGSYLQGRSTNIRLGEGLGPKIQIHTGIPQGSPLSPILYLFYNADLLEVGDPDTLVTGYIDDTSILVEGNNTEETCAKLQTIHHRAEKWATKHASVFAPQKYELIHFIHKSDRRMITDGDRDLTLELLNGREQVVHPTRKARYLGVILESDMKGKAHVEHARARASKSVQALQALAASTWGISRESMLKLYNAIIVPQITYACSVWYIPEDVPGYKGQRVRTEKILSTIQKEALRVATGAFRTTALGVLEAETNTMPIRQRLQKVCLTTALRIRGTPLYQKMITYRQQVRDQDWKSKRIAPLQRLETGAARVVGQIAVQTLERHYPAITPPWWKPPMIRIAPDRQTAIKEHDLLAKKATAHNMIIYTDGSDIRGHVGGAAATKTKSGWNYRLAYLGRSTQTTVYAAELAGLLQALQMGYTTDGPIRTLTIFTDNQAAIHSARRPSNQSGQWLLRLVVQLVERLSGKGVRVAIHWIAAHEGVEGNEMADSLAKEATEQCTPAQYCWTPPMKQLQASCKRILKKETATQWGQTWIDDRSGQLYRKWFGKTIRKDILTIYNGLPKALAAIVIQLRTGKVALAAYLHKIKKVENPYCDCREGNQTVTHILEECPLFRELRTQELGRPVIRSARDTLTDPKTARKAAYFMLKTGLLDQFRVVRRTLILN